MMKDPILSVAPNSQPSFPDASDDAYWAFINAWKVEPQSNDRAPVAGAIVPSTASASAVRSMTRRQQQAKFKEWSQNRHE